MELLQLHYFRTVARLEHMTNAAQELRVAQPALSKTISRLEEDLGVQLFDRHGRHIRLNTFGKTFLEKVETALKALEEGRREVSDLAGMEQGSITLATSTLNRLSAPLGAFLSRYPEVQLRLTQAWKDIGNLIESGEVDFGFTALPIEGHGIREQHVLSEEVFLALPPGHRLADRQSISLIEVAEEPFIGYKKRYFFQQMNDEFCRKAGFKPRVICEVDEPSAIGDLVRAGLGVAFVGACGKDEETSLRLLRIDHPDCYRTFKLAWRDNRYMSGAARKFRDFIIQYFDELRNKGGES